MKIKIIIKFIAFFLLLQYTYGNNLQTKIEKGINLIYSENYSASEKLFSDMIKNYPNKPEGYFFYGLNIYAQILELNITTKDSLFHLYMNRTIDIANKNANKEDKLFYIGSARFLSGSLFAFRNKFFKAYKATKSSINLLEQIDTTSIYYWDSQLAIANWDYWIAKKLPTINHLFLHYDMNHSLQTINHITTKGRIFNILATYLLTEIYFNEKMTPEISKKIYENITRLEANYPKTRMILWLKGKYFYRIHKFNEAEKYFLQLKTRYTYIYDKLNIKNPLNLGEIYFYLAYINYAKKNYAEAYKWCNKLLSMKYNSNTDKEKMEKYLKKIKKIYKKAEEYLN